MYSDFLPLNSPYANTNGQSITTYTYNGENGEYSNVTHYEYDARYDTDGSASNRVKANLWFGMRVDVHFGLPDTPGQQINGAYGNKDIYGNDMHFQFTGDDDVWILVDGKVVLDLGGIHQASDGDINFSTGEVRVNGTRVGSLSGIAPGEHTLSILYLERGASMSNCGIYFNLAPRFSLTLQKEDVLSQELLNGATFEFYYDQACTNPCDLWPSQQSYKNGDTPAHEFTIEDGKLSVWGLSPSRTYYIREKDPPGNNPNAPAGTPVYEHSSGVIKLTLDKNGLNSYSATMLEELDANGNKIPITNGYTVHGFRIDEENQAAYISVTNARNWVKHTTSVFVEKKWNDTKDHRYDSVTVYLNVKDPDGTVRRLREITLSKENNWQYVWSNLPMYVLGEDGITESTETVKYSISEAYVPGYTGQVSGPTTGVVTETTWEEATTFVNGEEYILKCDQGCLSTRSDSMDTLCFVNESDAMDSPLALWTATVSNGKVRLTNRAGQSLNCLRDRWCFNATANSSKTDLTFYSNGTGLSLVAETYVNEYYTEKIYVGSLGGDWYLSGNSPLIFHPMVKKSSASAAPAGSLGFTVTNTPLDQETSLKVKKVWVDADEELYEQAQVTFKLFADGKDTGRTETVTLKNDWTATFKGLPYLNAEGNPVVYTVAEAWDTDDWITDYGEIYTISGGQYPTYETTVSNHYRWADAFELPSTGGIGIPLYILCGLILVSAPLVYGLGLRRRYRKEAKK